MHSDGACICSPPQKGMGTQVLELAQGNKQFKVIDKAIGKQGFKVVTLLRLSPLLPLALSNYFYGLTSVDLPSYVTASWLGMLPGTIAYVTAGRLTSVSDPLPRCPVSCSEAGPLYQQSSNPGPACPHWTSLRQTLQLSGVLALCLSLPSFLARSTSVGPVRRPRCTGSYGRTVLDEGQGELPLEWWQVALGVGFTVGALAYLGKIAKGSPDDAEADTA